MPDALPPCRAGAGARRRPRPRAGLLNPFSPRRTARPGRPAADRSSRRRRPAAPAGPGAAGGAGAGADVAPPGQPPVGAGEPPGSFPSIPGMGMTNVGPDRNDPFPNRSFADVVTSVEEGPTGRFMVSVGANSFQGLMGGISIWEKNFDLFNSPESWSDIVNSKAFRGGGQELRINLQAGTLINLMQVSLREPVPLRPADRGGRLRLPVSSVSIPTGTSAAAAAASASAARSAP